MSAPPDQKEAEELTRLVASMEGAYGAGKYCPSEKTCLDIEQITEIIATSRDERPRPGPESRLDPRPRTP